MGDTDSKGSEWQCDHYYITDNEHELNGPPRNRLQESAHRSAAEDQRVLSVQGRLGGEFGRVLPRQQLGGGNPVAVRPERYREHCLSDRYRPRGPVGGQGGADAERSGLLVMGGETCC